MPLRLYKANANRAQNSRTCSSGYAEMQLRLYKGNFFNSIIQHFLYDRRLLMKKIVLILIACLFVLPASGDDFEYYMRQAEGYQREAEYYNRQAEGYDKEADYYARQAQSHLKEAAYYLRRGDSDRAKTYQSRAEDARDREESYRDRAKDARDRARSYLRKAADAMEKAQ